MVVTTWDLNFLRSPQITGTFEHSTHALIILNQPFSFPLLHRLWRSTKWHCCADGGANRLFDSFPDNQDRLKWATQTPQVSEAKKLRTLERRFLPSLIKGDLDSIREDVRVFYEKQVKGHSKKKSRKLIATIQGVLVVQDEDQDSTDLMKCVSALQEKEKAEDSPVRPNHYANNFALILCHLAISHHSAWWSVWSFGSNYSYPFISSQIAQKTQARFCCDRWKCWLGSWRCRRILPAPFATATHRVLPRENMK